MKLSELIKILTDNITKTGDGYVMARDSTGSYADITTVPKDSYGDSPAVKWVYYIDTK